MQIYCLAIQLNWYPKKLIEWCLPPFFACIYIYIWTYQLFPFSNIISFPSQDCLPLVLCILTFSMMGNVLDWVDHLWLQVWTQTEANHSLLIGFERTTDRNLTESQEMFKPSPELKWVRTQILILLSIEIRISFCYFFKEKLHLNGLDRCDKCIPFLNYPLCHRRYYNPTAMFPARKSQHAHTNYMEN